MKKNSKYTKIEFIHLQVGEGIVTYLALKLERMLQWQEIKP